MKKKIYQASFLILGLIFLSTAKATTCKEEYNGQTFDHAAIYDRSRFAYCYYSGNNQPMSYYDFYDHFIPQSGLWTRGASFWICSASAEDCQFTRD